jgi:hypothetical protein
VWVQESNNQSIYRTPHVNGFANPKVRIVKKIGMCAQNGSGVILPQILQGPSVSTAKNKATLHTERRLFDSGHSVIETWRCAVIVTR